MKDGIDVDRTAATAERLGLVDPDMQGPDEDAEMMAALWYEHDDGRLWIIGPDEIEGPDDGYGESLASACRHGYDLDGVATSLRLTRVPDALKRWGPMDGYYSA